MDYASAWFAFSAFLLGMYLSFDGFDLGIASLLPYFREKRERDILATTISAFWDGNEVWLITWGAGLFAMFPVFYATFFSTFYIAVWLLAFLLVFRAVSIEIRWRDRRALWDYLLSISSALIALFIGVVAGNLIAGFPISKSGFQGSLLTLFRPLPLITGLFVLSAVLWHGTNWSLLRIEGNVREHLNSLNRKFWISTVALWIILLIAIIIYNGYSTQRAMTPAGLTLAGIITLALVIAGFIKNEKLRFAVSFAGFPLVVACVYYSIYPYWIISTEAMEFSLSIYDAASSELTLKSVLFVSILLAVIILAYTAYVYRVLGGPVREPEEY